MKKIIILAFVISTLGGCTLLDRSRAKLENEIKSWNVIKIEKSSEDLIIWKTQADKNIYYKKGTEEGIVTDGKLLDYLINTLK